MKNIISLLLIISLVSCDKEPLYIPCTETYPTTQNPGSYTGENLIDGCWLLEDGEMYMENLETNELIKLPHFNNGDTSSLRYGGSIYDFENLVKNYTSWCFYLPSNVPGMGDFVLNNDTLLPYGLSVTNNNLTVTEPLVGSYLLLGGSGRPVLYNILDLENKIIVIHIQETYKNINGYNYKYHSKLKFKKY